MNVREIVTVLTNGNNETVNSLMEILDQPDEIFDPTYEALADKIDEVFSAPSLQESVLSAVRDAPNIDYEAEVEKLNALLEEIQKQDISDNKKAFLSSFLKNSRNIALDFYKNPRERIPVTIQRISQNAVIPQYANPSDAGADIYTIEDVVINPHETVVVPTGFTLSIPAGYAVLIYPRSGLSYKTKLRIANSVGVIDHLYHKEVGVIVENTGDTPIEIKQHERIAQMIITPVPMIQFQEGVVEENQRGGFGSTGMS